MGIYQQGGHRSVLVQRREDQENNKPGLFLSCLNSYYENKNSKKHANFYYYSIREIMDRVKSGNEEFCSDDYYKAMGSPNPEQYKAFNDLYSCLDPQNSDYFHEHKKSLYNLARLSRQPAALKMIKEIYDSIKNAPVKSIKLVCGSFWQRKIWLREEIIDYLNKLHTEHGVGIEFFTNCKEDGKGIDKLDKEIRDHYYHHLDNRVMIHHIFVEYMNDDIKMYIEFPHTEKHYFRLYMLLTPEEMNSPALKDKKHEIKKFFEGLIEKAMRDQ